MEVAGTGKERSIPKAAARAMTPAAWSLPPLHALARAASHSLSTLSACLLHAQGCPRQNSPPSSTAWTRAVSQGPCRGRYHTNRQPGGSQYTARGPGGPPAQTATAGAQL
jgi:hypothetical protein